MTSTSTRRQFLLAAGTAASGAAATPASGAAATPARPNIVVVLVDDVGFSDIGCYGGEIPTPNIDRLARRGIRFTQFYNTARCSPTRASLLTGLYPHHAGMGHLEGTERPGSRGYTSRLSDECVTIAEVLQTAGYFTAMTGKWHLGQSRGTPPWKRGFTRSLNSPFGELYFPGQRNLRGQPHKVYLNGRELPADSPELGRNWYSTDLWTDFGLRFIDEARREKKPFFLYLAHCAVHFPLMAPPEDIARFRGRFMAGWDRLRRERHQRQIEMGLLDPKWPLTERPPDSPAWDSLPQEDQERFDNMMAIYAAMLSRIDRAMGTLVDGLQRRGALDNTLILFLSDNGGNAETGPVGRYNGDPPGGPDSSVFLGMNWATLNNTPFRRYKHFTHEGGISTPLIAHWPSGIAKSLHGKFEAQPGHLVDIMPTAVELAGAAYPEERGGWRILPMSGTSLVPAFSGKRLRRTEPIFFFHEGNRAIRDGKWKLVAKYTEPWELYDMEADRTELRNLIGEHPGVARELAAKWDSWAERTYAEPWTGPPRNAWGQEMPQHKEKER